MFFLPKRVMIKVSGHLNGITLSVTLCKGSLLENVPCFSV